jgi:pyruvate kinase
MIAAGMDVARLNLSHGTRADHAGRVAALRAAMDRLGRLVAIMVDTRGPEVRVGPVADDGSGGTTLRAGDRLALFSHEGGRLSPGGAAGVWVTHGKLWRDVRPGSALLLDDGLLEVRVTSAAPGRVDTVVVHGGVLRSGKKLNAPGIRLSLPTLSEADREDLRWAASERLDFVAASFVQHPGDVLAIRRELEASGARMGVIAKIECQAGVDDLDGILAVSDGIMVARGDLGVEFPVEEVPVLQKRLIAAARRIGIPTITATQMLESMVHSERPTRAEASDVANAVWDGSDAVMLSEETAAGHHPVAAVETMARIATTTEDAFDFASYLRTAPDDERPTVMGAVTAATCRVADALRADAVVIPTSSGFTARMVARHRPAVPLVAATPVAETARALTLIWGVHPVMMPPFDSTLAAGSGQEDAGFEGEALLFERALEAAQQSELVQAGSLVVLTGGVPVGVPGTTNLLQVRTLGQVMCRGTGIGTGPVTGTVRRVVSASDAAAARAGEVLVAASGELAGFAAALATAAAAVVEAGGLTGAAAVAGLSVGRPVVVGAEGALNAVRDGDTVTIDPRRGLVYRGRVRVDGPPPSA